MSASGSKSQPVQLCADVHVIEPDPVRTSRRSWNGRSHDGVTKRGMDGTEIADGVNKETGGLWVASFATRVTSTFVSPYPPFRTQSVDRN